MNDQSFDMSEEEKKQISMEFITEAVGHLEILNEKLLKAEESLKIGEAVSGDDLNAMFRAAHTIKGTASFIGLKQIVTLTHDMETLLQHVKNGTIPLDIDIVDVLFSAMDMLEGLCLTLKEKGADEGDISDCVKNIKRIIEQRIVLPVKPGEKKAAVPGVQGRETKPKVEQKINKKYLDMFIFDTDQNIVSFEKYLLAFEENPSREDILNGLFRIAHTLKGSAGLVSAVAILRLAHSMENILSCFYNKLLTPDAEVLSLLFEALDILKGLNATLKKDGDLSSEIPGICAKLDEYFNKMKVVHPTQEPWFNKKKAAVESSREQLELLQKSVLEDLDVFKIIVRLEEGLAFKSVKATLLEERLKRKGVLVSIVPAIETILDDSLESMDVEITFCASLNEKEIKSVLATDGASVYSIERVAKEDYIAKKDKEKAVKDYFDANSEKIDSSHGISQAAVSRGIEISTIKIDSHKLDALMNLSGELAITRARFTQLVNNLKDEIFRQKGFARGLEKVVSLHDALGKDVSQNKVNKILTEMKKELNFLNSKVATDEAISGFARLFDEVTGTLGKISSGIQSGVMQTRMVPIEGVFTRFKRVVRDLSRELNKEVNFVVEGEETELDKKIIDSLGDPLTHMVRNAIDHGIEDKRSRLISGKPAAGTLRLKAFHQGNNICIEVSDDGRGIDAGHIARSVIDKGLIPKEKVEAMTHEEMLDLIFIPGFSMADKITDLSGRGVGMDVVKNMINSVNGSITIETKVGEGTTFILKMPLTLAIIQALLVVIAKEIYAFPLESVTEIVNINKSDIYSVDGNDTINLRHHVLSLVELKHTIGLRELERLHAPVKTVVVITDGRKKTGVVVDSLVGKEEIVIKALSEHFSGVKGVAGASILGNGKIALILDAAGIIDEA